MNFTYKKAPLIEVIAEVHSGLIPLTAIPGAAIDPFFAKASSLFKDKAADLGYGFIERLVTDDVPLEMIPHQVSARYRRAPDSSPLLQLGPGVFTANIVPPYFGWPKFRSVLLDGYAAATHCYREAGQAQPNPNNLILRYINGFTTEHGFNENQADFLKDHLGLTLNLAGKLPPELQGGWGSRKGRIELTAEAGAPEGSRFTLICGLGVIQSLSACIVELRVAGPPGNNIEAWFNDARSTIRSTFEAIISPELRERIGPKMEITSG